MAKPFFTLDCETDPFKYNREPKPFLWGLYCGAEDYYEEFERTEDMVSFIKDQRAVIYAHNGGKFDFTYLAPYFNLHERCLMINGRLVKVALGDAELRDSYALLPFPQKQFSEKVEIVNFEIFEKKNRYKKANWQIIRERCKQDCIGLWDTIASFNDTYGRHLTAAGAAIKTLQKIEEIKAEDSGQEFFNSMSKYYFGGRCECLKAGEYNEEIGYLDINSAYPRAMLEQHPWGTSYKRTYQRKPEICGRNFYTVSCASYGAFCRRDKGALVFDWDGERRIYCVTGWELLAAFETGKARDIEHIEQVVFYEHRDFSTFINHFWDLRQTTKKGSHENIFAKLMMNSAYGKFGSNPENYEEFMFTTGDLLAYCKSAGWEIAGEKGGRVLVSKPLQNEDMRFYNVATAASITGYVRAMLMRALASVENPIYCDTDSIIFTGKHKLALGDGLGDWKVEGEFKAGYFAGKKQYGLEYKKALIDKKTGEKIKYKIATKGSKLTYKDIKDITAGKIVEYFQDAPSFSWKTKKTSFLKRKIKRTA